MLPNRRGPGWAHGRLEARARMLERKGEDLTLARAIRVMLAWRCRVLEEKHGPPRDYSRQQSPSDGSETTKHDWNGRTPSSLLTPPLEQE